MISTRDRMAGAYGQKAPQDKATDGKSAFCQCPARPRDRDHASRGQSSHSLARPHRVAARRESARGPARGPRDAPAAPLAARSSRRAPRASRRYTDEPDARRRVENTPRAARTRRLRLTKTRAGPRLRGLRSPSPAPLRAHDRQNTPFLTKTPLAARQRARFFHQSSSRQREACSQHPRHRAPISPQKNHPFFLQRSGPRASRSSTRWLWRTRSSRRSSPR